MKAAGFSHELDDLGFEHLFYESILKRPGRLKYLKLKENVLFIKTPYPVSFNHLIGELLDKEPFMTIDDIVYELKSRWQITIDYDYAISLTKSTDYYYSEELEKVFQDKDIYYHYIFNS